MFSDIMRPKALSRRASSMMFSMATNAPPAGQRVVGRLDEVHLLLEVPVVKDHAHRDHVGVGQRIGEKVNRLGRDAVTEPGCGDLPRGDGRCGRQVRGDATHVRMRLRDQHGEQTVGAAHVAQRLVA